MDFFDEPDLEFGSGGTHVDIRHGIMLHGRLDSGEATAPTQIRVGLVGTTESVDGVRNWLDHCKAGIPAKASRLENLFPQFPGFGAATMFHSDLTFHDRWTSTLRQKDVDQLLKNPGRQTLVQDCVKLFVDHIVTVKETAGPMVVICAPPADLLEAVDARISRKGDTQEQDLDESEDEETVGIAPFMTS